MLDVFQCPKKRRYVLSPVMAQPFASFSVLRVYGTSSKNCSLVDILLTLPLPSSIERHGQIRRLSVQPSQRWFRMSSRHASLARHSFWWVGRWHLVIQKIAGV